MGEGVEERLEAALSALEQTEPFDAATLEIELGRVVDELGVKARELYQPIRVAITGTTISPGIFDSLAALGREQSLKRLAAALDRVRAQS
jgi:glutamyl-tRNA synthetase